MEDKLSLAIGKAGQNVRLAARLTGWKLDIKPADMGDGVKEEKTADKEEEKAKSEVIEETKEKAPKEEKSKEDEAKEENN